MLNALKLELHHTIEAIDEFSDLSNKQLQQAKESLEEEAQQLWRNRQRYIHEIRKKVDQSQQQLKKNTDELHLQAHLGVMQAHTLWHKEQSELKNSLSDFSLQSRQKSEHVIIQIHLGKMEWDDEFNHKKCQIEKIFYENRPIIEAQSQHALEEMHQYFDALKVVIQKT
ncbi:MAG: hypothetical protein HRU20_21975 [Pseudomonadales bacterium]|nr:hypothetical protein [Pseudomonadales bacterium]